MYDLCVFLYAGYISLTSTLSKIEVGGGFILPEVKVGWGRSGSTNLVFHNHRCILVGGEAEV